MEHIVDKSYRTDGPSLPLLPIMHQYHWTWYCDNKTTTLQPSEEQDIFQAYHLMSADKREVLTDCQSSCHHG